MTLYSYRWTLMGALLLAALPSFGDDWPQWMGPQRDSTLRETGLVTALPQEGLKTQWSAEVGLGYSAPVVQNGVVYLFDFVKDEKATISNNPGETSHLTGVERLSAIDAKTGKLLWRHEYPETYTMSYPSGPRAAPTVVGDRVYMVGAEGSVRALNTATGTVVWSKEINETYSTKTPQWGYAGHPLVDGDTVYLMAGGEGSTAIALDRHTGQEKWRALSSSEPGYSPPTLVEHQGKKTLVVSHAQALVGVDPATGNRLWSVPIKPDHGMAINAPRQVGDLLFFSAPTREAMVLRLTDGAPEMVWKAEGKQGVFSANSTPVIRNGVIYGCDSLTGALMAVDLATGKRLWQTFEPTTGNRRGAYGTAFIVARPEADQFLLFSETGDLILAKMTAEGYQELGRQKLVEPTNFAFGRDVVWSHPAFADRSVFVRNDKEMKRVDLAASSYAPPPLFSFGGAAKTPAHDKVSLEEAGRFILTMNRVGYLAYQQVIHDPKKRDMFTKNDLWAQVDMNTLHKDIFPAINYLWGFAENFAATKRGAQKSSLPNQLLNFLSKKSAKDTEAWVKSDAFLDLVEQELEKLEQAYRKLRVAAKPHPDADGEDFAPTADQWYPKRTDQDPALWEAFSQVAALEYFFYRIANLEIDLAQLYPNETSVRVRNKDSKKTLGDYFAFSSNPQRAQDLARRMARLEKDHSDLYGLYQPLRQMLVRYLAYQWEFHDLLLPAPGTTGAGESAVPQDVHSVK